MDETGSEPYPVESYIIVGVELSVTTTREWLNLYECLIKHNANATYGGM
jgi:hypothetical protein